MSGGQVTERGLENVSTNDSPIYTLFDAETVEELTREHILRLAVGVLGAVHIKNFSSPDDCADIMKGLESCPLGAYDEALIYPRIAKLGPAAYDFYASGGLDERYWVESERAVAARSTLLRGGDPLEFAVRRIRSAWGDDLVPARCGGRDMFAGMIREIASGAKLHFDEIVREFPGALDETVASFLTLNWYLSMPEEGGETLVWRHPWRPVDEPYRDGYGYSEEVVRDDPFVTVRPSAGDAVIFDSRNYHAVRRVRGNGRRVTLSFFLGVTGRGPLAIWS